MASNPRQFKHPVPSRQVSPGAHVDLISPEQLCKAAGSQVNITQVVWRGLYVIVRNIIDLSEMTDLVSAVLNRCWDGERYCNEFLDFEFRCAVITFYSNVTLPHDKNDLCGIVYGTDLYDTIKNNASQEQVTALYDAIKTYIKS